MTRSYERAQLRRYKQTHPWVRKLPKSMVHESRNSHKAQPIDLGVIDPYTENGFVNDEEEARRVGDGSWAIVYDTNREGEWLWDCAKNGGADHICSECKYTINTDFHVGIDYPHCPRCGAKMMNVHGVQFTDENIILY